MRWRGSYRPTAVSLDIFLPDMLGWTVLSQLKQDPATRHIPVQIVTLDEDRHHGLARGAFSFVNKPTTRRRAGRGASSASSDFARPRRKRLLVVEDDAGERSASPSCWDTTTSTWMSSTGGGRSGCNW